LDYNSDSLIRIILSTL